MKLPYLYIGTLTATTSGVAIPTTKAMLNGTNGEAVVVYLWAAADGAYFNPPGKAKDDTDGPPIPTTFVGPLPLPVTLADDADGTAEADRAHLATASGTVEVRVMVRGQHPSEG